MFAAYLAFERAKKERMQVAVHWQDADSSLAKAVNEVFPVSKIMNCGGHAGLAHKKILESRQKLKKAPKSMLSKYEATYPALGKLTCKCGEGNHSDKCECLTAAYISKAHTNLTLMEVQLQEEFVDRLVVKQVHE